MIKNNDLPAFMPQKVITEPSCVNKIKLKNLLLVFGFGFSFIAASALAADLGPGTVEFYCSISYAPCSIAPDSGAQRIPLGQVSSSALKDGCRSSSKMFKIKL
ncbi:hypothetical protein ACEE86_20740 [Proteus mirabilis]